VLPQDVQSVQSETQRSNGDPKIKINLRPQVKEAKRVGGQVARAAEKGTRDSCGNNGPAKSKQKQE
jgi:hypothetical protein